MQHNKPSIFSLVEETRFERREFSTPHNSYEDELRKLDAVRTGNITLARQIIKEPLTGTPGKLSEDSLRSAKNLFIANITTVSRAAIEGGMSNEDAFTLSDAYILLSEHSQTIDEVLQLAAQALLEYTTCVANIKASLRSPATEKAMDYISKHLHYPILLENIANEIHISPSYLSRLFHKETGSTLVAYIQQERVHAAKNLLQFSDYSFLEIATYLNFKSQSYFISIFKKYTGMTPSQYRKQH